MNKTLFVWTAEFNGILNGGALANKRIYDYALGSMENAMLSYFINHSEYSSNILLRIISNARSYLGYFNGLTPRMVKEIKSIAKDCTTVFLSSSLYGIVAKELRTEGYKGRIIVYFHNVEELYFDAILPKNFPFRTRKVKAAARGDELSCQYADTIVTLNSRDSDLLNRKYGRRADIILPITFTDRVANGELLDTGEKTSMRPLCTFIGSNFRANTDGLMMFVRNVLPHVDVDLKVVGKGMGVLSASLQSHGVEVIDNAPDLAKYYHEADFIIMPIFTGSGMKVKTCEALMYGKNILATNEALEGYEAEGIADVCNTAEEFINAIRHYTNEPISRYNESARKLFLNKYSNESIYTILEKLLH